MNADLAERLQYAADASGSKGRRKNKEKAKVSVFSIAISCIPMKLTNSIDFQAETASSILTDDRFSKLFNSEDFQVCHERASIHPISSVGG